MESFWHDLRFGGRVLLKNRMFTLMAVITLALGIGANTAIFSVIYGVLLRPLPYRDGKSLVVVHQRAKLAGVADMGFSVKEFQDFRDQNKTLDSVVEHHSMNFILYGRPEPERVQTGVVSANFFDALGVNPILGRTFTASDEMPGAQAVLVLSYNYWQQSHGGDPNIIGKVFQMNNRPHVVIGVLPPIPQYPAESDVYMPTTQCPFRSSEATKANRNARLLTVVFGRLRPGVPLEQAQADIDNVAGNLESTYPETYKKSEGYAASIVPLARDLTAAARPTLLILLATAGLVLLLACANVANLCFARVLQRQREVAMRVALGAGKGRLIRQLLIESTLLSLAGGAAGLLLAVWSLPILTTFVKRFTNRTGEIKIDLSVLAFTLMVSVVTGLAFGLLPTLSMLKEGEKGLSATLKSEGARSTSVGKNRIRSFLVIAQVAISFTLLITAGLMLRSFIRLQRVEAGFNPEKVLVMRLSPNWSKYTNIKDPTATAANYVNFYRQVLEKVKQQPGLQGAALSSTYPLNPQGITGGPNNVSIQIEGQVPEQGQLAPQIALRSASPDYFRTLSTPIERGRVFSDSDNDKAPQVAIVNARAARHYWPNADPLDSRISFDNGKTWVSIVGVVGDVKQYGLERDASDEIYLPVEQSAFAGFVLAKTMADPMSMSRLLKDAVHQVDADTAIDQVKTLEQVKEDSVASPRLTAWLLGLFAALALMITAAGISAVIALSVTQRTREIGIRMALGASRGKVLGMIMRQGLLLVGIGLAGGVIGALAIQRLMSSLLFDTPAVDPITFSAVAALLICVAGTACLVPAMRATGINPTEALRSE